VKDQAFFRDFLASYRSSKTSRSAARN